MTAQLPIFADCPYGGCQHSRCACLEEALHETDGLDQDAVQLLDDLDAGRAVIHRRRVRRIETIPPLDTYEPPQGP
ncbi:hypothetical protein [Streptomyces sp. JB150]|uniref:hypothetical protein n=1 Tax=Streptomyces sp. JB150 TaxID=2714844 RepID=UPI001408C2C1|nr:hypothetical protein [Streptomyces sp. JB150]QIJ62586.1 hypothetical protein G7Z13_11465 [Streptomyces sp. JB150]